MEPGDIVLIADADESSRALLSGVLRNAGYQTLEAETGDEGLELARANAPTAAILEIPLAGLSGYELCAALKVEFGADMPVIFLTGTRTEPYDRVAGLLLGADDYLTKPYIAGELLVRLRNLLHRRADPRRVTLRAPPHQARARGARAHGGRPSTRRDRAAAVHQPEDRRHTRRAHPA